MHSELHSELPLVRSLKSRLALHSTVLVGMPAGANPAFHQKPNQAQILNGRLVLRQTVRSDWLSGTNPAFHQLRRSELHFQLHLGRRLKQRSVWYLKKRR
jgi:hypothetical protein